MRPLAAAPLAALFALLPACARAFAQPAPAPAAPAPAPAAPAPDPDGNDDPTDSGTGSPPAVAHFERVGRAPLSLRRICDLTVFADALYASHANSPLGSDGATITRYAPPASPHAPAFTVAFDWNRPGEPTRGGGAGQGFLRVHAIDGRLFVPDTDPPYAGFGFVDPGTEGYVFVSDRAGAFAPPRGEHLRPPAPPDAAGRAGAAVLPRAYHVLDVISFRGHLYASTGSVPPGQRAWYGASPGALHVANERLSRWTYAADYPFPWQSGVWRLTFLTRFRGRLYAGIQDYDWREPNDFVIFAPPAGVDVVRREDARAMRVSDHGGAQTLRWFTDNGRLYWIALERGWRVSLRVSDDGEHFRTVSLPADAGAPTDLVRFRGALFVLAEHGLYRLDGDTAVQLASVPDVHSPFAVNDLFCAAPLAVYRNTLYAGGQRDGALYRLVDGPAPAPRRAP